MENKTELKTPYVNHIGEYLDQNNLKWSYDDDIITIYFPALMSMTEIFLFGVNFMKWRAEYIDHS